MVSASESADWLRQQDRCRQGWSCSFLSQNCRLEYSWTDGQGRGEDRQQELIFPPPTPIPPQLFQPPSLSPPFLFPAEVQDDEEPTGAAVRPGITIRVGTALGQEQRTHGRGAAQQSPVKTETWVSCLHFRVRGPCGSWPPLREEQRTSTAAGGMELLDQACSSRRQGRFHFRPTLSFPHPPLSLTLPIPSLSSLFFRTREAVKRRSRHASRTVEEVRPRWTGHLCLYA